MKHHFKPNYDWTQCLLCGQGPGDPGHWHVPVRHWEYRKREHINNLVEGTLKNFTSKRWKLKPKPKQPTVKIRRKIMKQIDVTGRYSPMPNLQEATDEALLEWYNKHSGSTQLAKFASREVAVQKCSELKNAMDQLASHANADAQPKTKSGKKEKEKQTMKTANKKPAAKKQPAKGKGKKGAAKKGGGGRDSKLNDMVLKKLTKENPRREGSHGYKSFALIRDGMTYREFIDKGGRNKDLRCDIDNGHVKLVAK